MEFRALARYPFLKDATHFVKERELGLDDLLKHTTMAEARRRGKARVLSAISDLTVPNNPVTSEDEAVQEILSYPYARILVSCIGDDVLVRRYALAEAKTFNERLRKEDMEMVVFLAGELEVEAVRGDSALRMHFTDFLNYTSGLRGPEWKLVNQDLRTGFVQLDKNKFVRVLEQALNERIEDDLPLPVNDELLTAIENELEDIVAALEEFKEKYRGEGFGEVSILKFPPCMKKLVAMAQAGQNMPHAGRFALTSFLSFIGMPVDDIIKLFCSSPDFDHSKTAYQVRHITGDGLGKRYTPPECATMKTTGLCFEPDELCNGRRVQHPLTYYRIRSYDKGKEKKVEKDTMPPSAPSR
ncbi:MAG: DNA primase large subunit PriL [Methanomassiliicoccales archaeon]|nr:DNA primase large subunit PriL [Methanomassiliicoccales archaeon]TFG57100.1 MAG: DNA primase [Methanomassiliicoccus sp.]